MKRIIAILAVIMLLTGCGGKEVNDRVYVKSVGITVQNAQISLFILPFAVEKDDDFESEPQIVVITAKNVADAIEEYRIYDETGKNLFFGLAQTAVISENAADALAELTERSGLSYAADVIISDSPEAYMAVTPKKAKLLEKRGIIEVYSVAEIIGEK